MKKFISSLAIASVALVGLLSSCQVEDIETTFDPASAEATITATVFNAFTGEDITKLCTIDAASNLLGADVKVASNVVTLTGCKSIVAQQISVKAFAKYDSETYESSTEVVKINELVAGAKASYGVTLIIGVPTEYTYERIAEVITEESVATFVPHDGHSLDHAGMTWATNPSVFLLKTNVKYTETFGVFELLQKKYGTNITPDEKEVVDVYAQLLGIPTVVENEAELPIQISGFAMYTVNAWHDYEDVTYGVYHKKASTGEKVLIGEITLSEIYTHAEYMEKALYGHESHYTPGTGHDDVHGYSKNAGGGIVWAD